MKTRFLFPYWCRYVGYACILGHVPIMILIKLFKGSAYMGLPDDGSLFSRDHVFFMATGLLMTVGLFLVAFSKEKVEDEQISQLRLDSLQWAIYLNYLLLTVSLIFTNDREHVLFLNLWIPLVFFIIRFRWKIYQINRLLKKDSAI
jgi:hypothetical protein